jgi:hypothetical protein
MSNNAGVARSRKVLYTLSIKQIKADISNDILDKLFAGVRFDANDKGCWVRGNDSTIYTTLNLNGKAVRAHRLSYELFHGEALTRFGCHSCDVKACINPDHILDRSNKWNFQDAMSKGIVGRIFLGNKPKPEEVLAIDYTKTVAPAFVERIS